MENFSYLLKDVHPITVTVIGAGGNGSLLVNQLARINVALKAFGRKGIHVNLFDFDKVELPNIGRQMYTYADIGQHKSNCVITRVNRFFGTSWNAYCNKIEDTDDDLPDEFCSNIIITCTDNKLSRINLNKLIKSYMNKKYRDLHVTYYWIDLANRKDIGQIIMGSYVPNDLIFLPNVVEYFKDYDLEPDDINTPSCSLAEALEKQDLFINSFITNVAAKLIWDVLNEDHITWHGAFINTKTLNIKKVKC